MNKLFKKVAALSLAITMVSTSLIGSVAAETNDGLYFEANNFLAEKISNPDKGSGEVDGLLPYDVLGEDVNRYQSYSWSMAEYGDSIYIGTCWNPIAGIYYRNVKTTLTEVFVSLGLDYVSASTKAGTMATSFVDLIYGEDLADGSNSSNGTPCIIRINKYTDEISLVYMEEESSAYINWNGYRTAVVFNDKLYFVCAGFPVSRLIEVNPDTGTSKVVLQRTSESTAFANGIRGLSVIDGQLIVALSTDGADPDNLNLSPLLPEANQNAYREIAKSDTRYTDPNWDMEGVRVLSTTDPSDPENWEVIANQETFHNLPACWVRDSINGGAVWDIKVFDGSLYVTIVTGKTDPTTGITNKQGFAMYKGTQSTDGWDWTPIIGDTENGAAYPFGMGLIWPCAGNILPYNDYLYIAGYNDPMLDLAATVNMDNIDWSLLYGDLKNPTHLYRMDKNGVIEEIVDDGFGAPTNQYVWNMAEYDGQLVIGTYDTATLTSGFTQLTDGSFTGLSNDEFKTRLGSIIELLDELVGLLPSVINSPSDDNNVNSDFDILTNGMDEISNDIDSISDATNNSNVNNLTELTNTVDPNEKDVYEKLMAMKELYDSKLKDIISFLMPSTAKEIDAFFADKTVLNTAYYFAISDIISQADKGFDLLMSKDGINFDTVTRNGFGDEFNHGAKGLLSTADGLYVGTANPFYGTQLWKLTNGSEKAYPVIDENNFTFDTNDAKKISVNVTLNDAVFAGIDGLVEGEDYIVNQIDNDNIQIEFTIKYLLSLEVDKTELLTLTFENADDIDISINVIDSYEETSSESSETSSESSETSSESSETSSESSETSSESSETSSESSETSSESSSDTDTDTGVPNTSDASNVLIISILLSMAIVGILFITKAKLINK